MLVTCAHSSSFKYILNLFGIRLEYYTNYVKAITKKKKKLKMTNCKQF